MRPHQPFAPLLNRKLALEEEVHSPDGAGGWQRTWSKVASFWASLEARSASEGEERGRERSRVRWRILVRSVPVGSDLRPRADQRFREGGRVFRITGVAEADPRGRFLACWAEEEAVQ